MSNKTKIDWKKNLKKNIETFALSFGLMLMIGIIFFGEDFRNSIGEAFGVLLGPLPEILQPHMIIFVLSTITGLYASIIQKYTMDWELMKKTQEKMKKFQKEFREAQKSENKYKLKKLEEMRNEMMQDQSMMFKQQFKPMMYISIISIPLFMWVYLFVSNHPDAYIVFPFMGKKHLTDAFIGPIQSWIVWYFFCSILVSQIISKTLDIGGM